MEDLRLFHNKTNPIKANLFIYCYLKKHLNDTVHKSRLEFLNIRLI